MAAQIFNPVCPPAPPPPVAIAAAPCGGGPAMMSQTNANGQKVCWTATGGYGLMPTPCSNAPDQLWTGWDTDRVAVQSIANWWCVRSIGESCEIASLSRLFVI